jgi:hypothetical protein
MEVAVPGPIEVVSAETLADATVRRLRDVSPPFGARCTASSEHSYDAGKKLLSAYVRKIFRAEKGACRDEVEISSPLAQTFTVSGFQPLDIVGVSTETFTLGPNRNEHLMSTV